MQKRFMTAREVADFLCTSPKTLLNHASEHEVFRPIRKGVWHIEQVKILENVWAGILTAEEGLSAWNLVKSRMRSSYMEILGSTGITA